MKTSQEIEQKIMALHPTIEKKISKLSSPEARNHLEETRKDIKILENSWNQAKKEQQHLITATLKKFEADVSQVVQDIKTVEEKYG